MIEIICRDNRFLVKGTCSLGIAGVYENKDFGEGTIEIKDSLDHILKELEKENSLFYRPLFPYLKGKTDGDAIAGGLADYYNQKEKEIRENRKQINDCILYHLFTNLEDCEYPFWEIEGAIIPGSLDGVDLDSIYDTEEAVYKWWTDFDRKPNNGSMEKVDVEGKLRNMFPMFDFDGLYRSIKSESLVFDGRFLCFQFSDGWGEDLFCSASVELDENLVVCGWDNH